jgi:N-acetylglucosamine kinase-like BadF-type ATPase
MQLDIPLGFREYAKADAKYYAGVDCTQLKAFARILDTNHRPIQSNYCSGPLNPYVFDVDDVVDTIHGAVINTIKITTPRLSPHNIAGIAVVMPSSDKESYRPILENRICMKWLFGKIDAIVVQDIDLIMDEISSRGAGLVLSSGVNDREYGRSAGGAFYRAESSGFGYELANGTINAVVDSAKGIGPLTTLLPHFKLAFDVDRVDDIVSRFDFFNEADRGDTVQEVLSILAEEAEFGDRVSRELCEGVASRYADLAKAGIRQLRLEEHAFPIALRGDVWKLGPAVTDSFHDQVKTVAPRSFLANSKYDLAELAAFLAIERSGW